MDFIKNLSMRSKLLLLSVPPMLVLQLIFAERVFHEWQQYQAMQNLLAQTELMQLINPVVTELQRERGRTAGFIASKGQAGNDLASQKQRSDTAINTLKSSALSQGVEALNQPLVQLMQVRQQVSGLSLSAPEAITQYSELIANIMSFNKSVIQSNSVLDSMRKSLAYWAIAEITEFSGQERAIGNAYLNNPSPTLDALLPLIKVQGQQQGLEKAVQVLLTDDEISFWQQALNSNENQALLNTRAQLERQGLSPEVSANQWFAQTTARIDRFTQSQKEILATIVADSNHKKASAFSTFWLSVVLMIFILWTGMLLVYLMVRQLNKQMSGLTRALNSAMQNKDLTQRLPDDSKDEIGVLANNIDGLYQILSHSLNHLDRASDHLNEVMDKSMNIARKNTHHIEKQQQQVDQAATATEEMSSTSAQISQNILRVAEAAQSVRDKSHQGDERVHLSVQQVRTLAHSVESVNELMQDLQQRSGSMIQVIDAIKGLADQTNLLALNAAIEAARAGEHGRGFAVVADEVRKLAQETHDSTQQIQDIIQSFTELSGRAAQSIEQSHKISDDTLELSTELERIFGEILGDVRNISDMSAEIATASEEQVAVSREIARNMDAIQSDAVHALEGAIEIQAVASEQTHLATELKALAGEFKTRQ